MLGFLVPVIALLHLGEAAVDTSAVKTLSVFRECLGKKQATLCIKEKAMDVLNETIMSDKPFIIDNMVFIERNPKYNFNLSQETMLNLDSEARSSRLSDVLHDMVEEYFKSRVFKFTMTPDIEEGRAKRKPKGGMGMMMVAFGGMACMMAQMFLGKVAFLAGTALIISKIALFLSAIIGLKKLSSGGGGGGETSHVVYTSGGEGHSHGGGGGGSWHRSYENDGQAVAYRAQIDHGY